MKKFINAVIILGISMMCTAPVQLWGQNRRTVGNAAQNSGQRTEESSTVKKRGQNSESANSNSGYTGGGRVRDYRNDGGQNKTQGNSQNGASPAGNSSRHNNSGVKTQQQGGTNVNTNSNGGKAQQQSGANVNANSSGVKTQRQGNVNPEKNNGKNAQQPASVNPNGKNVQQPGDSNRDIDKDKGKERDNGKEKDRNSNRINSEPNRKPDALQYHNTVPQKRDKDWERPYLEKKSKPAPSYQYGEHNYGYRCKSLPSGYKVVHVGGHDYYRYNEVYYRKYGAGGYVVCRPPAGIKISSTIFTVALTTAVINILNGVSERIERAQHISNSYSALNKDYRAAGRNVFEENVMSQDGKQYYYEDGVFYTLDHGIYYVIEAPIGALVTRLPYDYEEVEMNSQTYYLVENTLYKTTIIDGALYFEVVCNL